ncbi:MAG: glycosyltransferase, partial [Nitrospira sp.]|nr:glycosyltransferase [Nitrospira sp.]
MSSALKKIPLAFFAYNRPKHTERALNALAACERREDFEFYFFSDGPRNAETEAGVAEVRQTLKANAERFSAEIILRPANLGLARSIVDGVGRLCESHGRVVVLEDDLVVSPDFLHFMASALDHYADVSQVM